MSDTNTSLRESIENAAKEQGVPPEENINDTDNKENSSESQETVSKEAEEETSEDFKPDPEIEEAVNFYKALKDPNQQVQIIGELARRAGLLQKNEQPTAKEEKKYSQLIEEILGEEYPDLKDKLGKVFTAFEKESDEKLAAIRRQIEYDKAQEAVREFDNEYSAFLKDNKISESTAALMMKEIEVLPPQIGKNGRKISLTEYLHKIHKLVDSDKQSVNREVKRAEKIENNLSSRVKNLATEVGEERLKQGSRLPSIRESVSAAAKGVKFDDD